MDKVPQIQKLAQDLFNQVGLELQLEVKEDAENIINVNLLCDNSGILIGYHGETLLAVQHFLSLATFRQFGEWTHINVDIGDYRLRRQEALNNLALSAAEKVVTTGEPFGLPPMSAYERRLVHIALADHPEVETVSEGEGFQRRVVVQPKAK